MKKSLKIGLSFTMFVCTMLLMVVFSLNGLNESSNVYEASLDNLTNKLNTSVSKAKIGFYDAYDGDLYWSVNVLGDFEMRKSGIQWTFYENDKKIGEVYSHDIDFKLKIDIFGLGSVKSDVDGNIFDFKENDVLEFKSIPDDRSYDLWENNGEYADASDEAKVYIFEFEKPRVPGISGESTVINNIDKPYSIDRIKEIAMLAAYDAYYGDLTEGIEVVRDDYTANKSKVGNFEIEFRVENPNGLSANFILIVANKDLAAPTITGPGTSTMSYTEEFVLSNLIAKFTVKDNHDLTVKLVHIEDNFVQGVPGTYSFKFEATDSSKNVATFVHTITVVDDQKAIITDDVEGPIEVNWRDKITDDMLLVGLTAHDEISGQLTDRLKVTNNPIKKELGTYQVEYQVTDDAGNVSKYTRTYKVVTTDAPIFYVSKNLILISDVNLLTTEQIVSELARYEDIQYASHMVIENEYLGNEYTPGSYKVRVAINDVDGIEHIVERTIEVFEENENLNPKTSIWEKISNFFKAVWNVVKSIFNGIWTAIKFIWKYTIGGLINLISKLFTKSVLMLFLSI